VDNINAAEDASPVAANDSWYFTDNGHQQRGEDPQQHQNIALYTLGMVTIPMSDDDTGDFNDEERNDDPESASVHGAGGAADGSAGESTTGESVEAAVKSDVGTAGAAGEAQSGPPQPGPSRAVIDLTGDDNEEAEPVPRRGAQCTKKRRL
jgi:hypothetical protein